MSRAPKRQLPLSASTDSDLRKDALAGQKLSAEADDESHHGEAAIPGFSERREAELCVHDSIKKRKQLYRSTGALHVSDVARALALWATQLLSSRNPHKREGRPSQVEETA